MLFTSRQLAERWQCSEDHLRDLRRQRRGPAFIRFGHHTVRYRLEDILAYEHEYRRYH